MAQKREYWEGPYCLHESSREQTIIRPISILGTLDSKPRLLSESLVKTIYSTVLKNIVNMSGQPVAVCLRRIHLGEHQKALYLYRLSGDEFAGPFCLFCLLADLNRSPQNEIYKISTRPKALIQLLANSKPDADLHAVKIEIDPLVQLF
jgi:hypothetical protein